MKRPSGEMVGEYSERDVATTGVSLPFTSAAPRDRISPAPASLVVVRTTMLVPTGDHVCSEIETCECRIETGRAPPASDCTSMSLAFEAPPPPRMKLRDFPSGVNEGS